jgi:hypothetical protein
MKLRKIAALGEFLTRLRATNCRRWLPRRAFYAQPRERDTPAHRRNDGHSNLPVGSGLGVQRHQRASCPRSHQIYRDEIAGGYLWSPKRNANKARDPFYESMREVAPGDFIFTEATRASPRIGRARSYC